MREPNVKDDDSIGTRYCHHTGTSHIVRMRTNKSNAAYRLHTVTFYLCIIVRSVFLYSSTKEDSLRVLEYNIYH